jgi:hypothetical protein
MGSSLPGHDDPQAQGPSPYAGARAVVATQHGKERAIGPAMAHLLGVEVFVPDRIDTDVLGTFSGDVARPGSMIDTAVAKARLGMALEGCALGLASEGSYGAHPRVPFLKGGLEIMVFVDQERGLVIAEEWVVDRPHADHRRVRPDEDIRDFVAGVDFPAHGLLVRPAAPGPGSWGAVSVRDMGELGRAVARAAGESGDGHAVVFTDMRADRNPVRMENLVRLAHRLARRIRTPCPACHAPGYGLVRRPEGLPCRQCGTPSTMLRGEVWGCAACPHEETRQRPDGRTEADPGACTFCNP